MTGPSVGDSERGPASGVSWRASPSLQVIAGGNGGTWFEILRTGALRRPLDAAADPSGPAGPTRDRSLDDLLSWLPADELRRVRSAMQSLRLGLQTWQGDVMLAEGFEPRGPGRLELTGGPWRAGLWAYVLRLSAVPEADGDAADDGNDPAASIGRIAYADDLGTVTLDEAAIALIAPSEYSAAGLPLHHWSQCFAGDDQMKAISALVWPMASPRPKGVTLRLATGSGAPVRRIELHVHRGGADGAVVALCRAHPEDLRAERPGA